ncbi:MAG: hypothetical protein GKS01_03270 [Alphaproteobacteria bacterium]|nr:hypothetical protein [Alphaproteobacteria bacterium]
MRGLKGLVIGMGVLIVVGLTVVIVTVIKRYDGGDNSKAVKSPAVVSVPVEHGFGEKRIQVPKGAKITETILEGKRLIVRLELSDGAQAFLLIDVNTGQRIGLIRLGSSQ